jgi:hypothetical protein
MPSILPLKSSLSVKDYSTIRMQTLSRNETAILAGKEDEARRDLARLARSSHGRGELILGFFIHGCGDEGCPHCVVYLLVRR